LGKILAVFERWKSAAERVHTHFAFTQNQEIHWTPLPGPINEVSLALISTSGVHRRDQEAFDVRNEAGDHSFREIHVDTTIDQFMITHTHYNHEDADKDINCVFPLLRLHELVELGIIKRLSESHFGLMGFIPNPEPLLSETAPQIGHKLKEQGVDAVLMTPG
jgi:D-proline reductase (dithiol) PrdB